MSTGSRDLNSLLKVTPKVRALTSSTVIGVVYVFTRLDVVKDKE